MFVQVGLCRTCSETTLLVFPRGGSYIFQHFNFYYHVHVSFNTYTTYFHHTFSDFQRYLMGNVFCLPKNFTLPSDRVQLDKPCSEGQMNDLDTRLQEVKDKIIAVRQSVFIAF